MNFIKKRWTKKDYNIFIKELKRLEDIPYKKFHSKLILEEKNIIGIRTPKLKEIAKEIAQGNYLEFLNQCQNIFYEEKVISGLIIGYIKTNFQDVLTLLNHFIEQVDNWAINDIVCANLKIFKKHQEEGFFYIKKLLKKNKPFSIRFGLVLLLDFYINDQYIDQILDIASSIWNNHYYVKMANAWLISICYIKYPKKTKTLLEKQILDPWTQNKAISKIKDSKRVTEEVKKKLEILKRQN